MTDFFSLKKKYPTRYAGSFSEEKFVSQVVHLIIAGNSLAHVDRITNEAATHNLFKQKVSQQTRHQVSAPLKELDSLVRNSQIEILKFVVYMFVI